MSFLKSKLNLLNIVVVATSLSLLPTVASANPPVEGESEMAPVADLVPSRFENSDLNGDGTLDMSEFTLYAGDQAVGGDPDFTAIVSTGDYETAFKLIDADGNGIISPDELRGQDDELDEGEDIIPEGEVTPRSDY